MGYAFYGWETADSVPVTDEFTGITDPRKLYDALTHVWCRYTCAPRLRDKWSEENITLGQCSITAFLCQDIFGGQVFGVLRPAGNYHCYNVIGDRIFDLTSEQFGVTRGAAMQGPWNTSPARRSSIPPSGTGRAWP